MKPRSEFQGVERVVIDSKEPRRRSLAAHSHRTISPPSLISSSGPENTVRSPLATSHLFLFKGVL